MNDMWNGVLCAWRTTCSGDEDAAMDKSRKDLVKNNECRGKIVG